MRWRLFALLLGIGLLLSACGTQAAVQPPERLATTVALATTVPTGTPIPPSTPPPTFVPTTAAATQPASHATLAPVTAASASPLSVEAIAEQLRPATVRVVAEFGETALNAEGLGAGTGIVYDLEHGYIVTNAHVVEGASVVKIAQADSTKLRPARVVGRSPCDDLAVLQVETTAGLQAARLGESSAMKAGADVVALGYPLSFDLGTDLSVNAGNISQLNAQLSKFENLIKIDAAINPGNSGGPLVNRFGEVIGINSLGIAGAQNQNYAIAISRAKPIIHQLEEGQDRHYIGLNLVPNEYAEYFGTSDGMAIIAVASGSPAAQGGVQPTDLLLKLEGKAIDDEETVCDILRSHAPGDRLRLTVFRADTGELLEGELTMGRSGASDASANKLAVIGVVEAEDDAGEQAAAEPDAGQQDAPQHDASAVCGTATVAGVESLAIRAHPTRSSAMLGEVAGGGMVDVLCGDPIEADGRTWLAVRHGAIEGYMSARYLQW